MAYSPQDQLNQVAGLADQASGAAGPEHAAAPGRARSLRGADKLQALLADTDLEMIRVLEDLITVLIDKRIIMLTDLPQAAQAKLAKRYQLRSSLSDLGGIVAESDDFMLP